MERLSVLTFDPNTVDRLSLLYPDVRTRWIRVANDFFNLHKLQLKIAQGLRTYSDQQKIYSQGRALKAGKWVIVEPGKVVSYAPPGESWHHYSALDSCFAGTDPWLDHHPDSKKLWADYAEIGKAHGFIAGHDWPTPKQDRPHLEIRYGLELSDARKLYQQGKLAMVWARFDQVRGVETGTEWAHGLAFDKLKKLGVIA